MVKEEELFLLKRKIKSVIGQSRGAVPPYNELIHIEIDHISDVGDSELVGGRWSYFLRSGRFDIKIKKDDKSIVDLKITETGA